MPRKSNTYDFIEKSKKIHGDKYDYSKTEYSGSNKKVVIICPKHGEFRQTSSMHLSGNGCPICANENRTLKYTTETFIEKCKEKWGDRYSYGSTVYNGILKPVIITCQIHGDFEIIANDFLSGHGCQECGGTKKLTTETFVEKAKKIHGDIYNYSKVEYINSSTKVCIICSKHGEFWQTPRRHLSGDRCPGCFKSEKKTTEQFIDESRVVHGNKYDYSKVVYNGNKKKIEIICPQHGSFFMTPLYHLQGHGCLCCRESHLERDVNNILGKLGLLFIRQKRFDWLGNKSLDFYIPRYNLAIECQGEQHFAPLKYFGGIAKFEKRLQYDIDKNIKCKENGVKILYVVGNKKDTDYENSKYNGIYNGNIFDITEIEEKLNELCQKKSL